MLLHDRATIEGNVRITPEGYLVADAYVALANNIQDYHAAELGLTDREPTALVRVFRPESEVFAVDSVASASRLPITLKHPAGMVDAKNWRDLAKGETGEEIMRDGDRMRVPLRVTDAGGVSAVRTNHGEFSLGYTAELKLEAGVHDGKPFDAKLSTIRYNHLAAVPKARGGPELRIVDERTPLRDTQEPTMKKIMLDGLQVDLSDAAAVEVAIGKLQTQFADANAKLATSETTVAAHVATIAAKDAEIVTLTQAVKDAKVTPAQLRDAGKAYDKLVTDAKRLVPTLAVTDAMDEPSIKKAAVSAKLGDAAKDFTDAQIDTAFATSIALLGDAPGGDQLRDAIRHQPASMADEKVVLDARAEMIADIQGREAA